MGNAAISYEDQPATSPRFETYVGSMDGRVLGIVPGAVRVFQGLPYRLVVEWADEKPEPIAVRVSERH